MSRINNHRQSRITRPNHAHDASISDVANLKVDLHPTYLYPTHTDAEFHFAAPISLTVFKYYMRTRINALEVYCVFHFPFVIHHQSYLVNAHTACNTPVRIRSQPNQQINKHIYCRGAKEQSAQARWKRDQKFERGFCAGWRHWKPNSHARHE